MHSPAINVPAEDEDGANNQDTNRTTTTPTTAERSYTQDDVDSLIENLQGQADSISYEIEKIVGVHKDAETGKSLYQVRWVAYTWIPEECLGSFQHLIKEYNNTNYTKPSTHQDNVIVSDNEIRNSSICVKENHDSSLDENLEEEEGVGEGGEMSAEEDEDEERGDNKLEPDGRTTIKQEGFSTDNPESYPLPTAFMVTIDETADNLDDADTEGKQTAMNCPKCEQRFFLKSNLEVHVLFCKGNDTMLPCSPGNDNMEVTVTQEEVDSSMNDEHGMNDTSRPIVFSEGQTFEYVPLDGDSTECTTCTQRLPEGAIVGDSLTDLSQLVAHSRKRLGTDNEVEIYECDECDREFLFKYPMKKSSKVVWIHKSDEDTLAKRRKIKHEKPFSCSICNRGFETELDKVEHEVKHANTQSRYSCATCGEKFITRNLLQQHYDARDECQPTKCEVCGKTFVHSSHLKRHLSIHAGIKPFVCSICGHEFNQRSDLQRHERKHTMNGKFTCLKCVHHFPSIDILKEHILSHRSDENTKQVFACERCDKVFGRKSHYKRHMTIHDGIKPYSCEKCGKSFNQRTDLKRHQLSHMRREMKVLATTTDVKKTESNLICVICNKVFTNHAAFLEHDLVHQKIMSTGVLY